MRGYFYICNNTCCQSLPITRKSVTIHLHSWDATNIPYQIHNCCITGSFRGGWQRLTHGPCPKIFSWHFLKTLWHRIASPKTEKQPRRQNMWTASPPRKYFGKWPRDVSRNFSRLVVTAERQMRPRTRAWRSDCDSSRPWRSRVRSARRLLTARRPTSGCFVSGCHYWWSAPRVWGLLPPPPSAASSSLKANVPLHT